LSSKFRSVLLAMLLCALGIAAYWQALRGYFLSDDFVHLLYMQRVDDDIYVLLKNFWSNWLDIPTTLFFRPLVSVTLYVDHLLWGWRPEGYHLTNIVIHAMNGVLIFLISRRLAGRGEAGGQIVFAFLGAMLFLVWPLHVEAVYWIVGRVDVQLTFFYLIGIYCFLLHIESGRALSGWLSASLLAFLAALSTKEPAVTLPAVLAAYCFFYNSQRDTPLFRRFIVAMRLTAPIWGVLIVYFFWRRYCLGTFGGGYTGGGTDYFSASYWGRWKALGALFFPINRAWPESVASRHLMGWLFGLGWAFMAYTVFHAFFRMAGSGLRWGTVAFIISLLPLMSVFHVAADLQSSRFLYLPTALFWITLAVVLGEISGKAAQRLIFCGLLASIVLLAAAGNQLRLNLGPWIQASEGIQVFSKDLDRLVAQRYEAAAQHKLLVLAGIPDNVYGAQFLRNGYGGFLGTVFRPQPINNILPLTDDDRTGVMPIFAKSLAASDNDENLYGIFRYFPEVGIKKIESVRMRDNAAKNANCRSSVLGDKLSDLSYRNGEWFVTGDDPFVMAAVGDCPAKEIREVRVSAVFQAASGSIKPTQSLQFFWRAGGQSFSEVRSLSVPLVSDGQMHDYVFSVGGTDEWPSSDQIAAIRLDFPGEPGARVQFTNVRFVAHDRSGGLPRFEGAELRNVVTVNAPDAYFDDAALALTLKVSKKDEFILLPKKRWSPLEGDVVSIRMRVVGFDRPRGSGKLYWASDNAMQFSEDKSVEFPVSADGVWRVLTIPLRHMPTWWTNGQGTQLRINPFYGNAEVQIASVEILAAEPRPILQLKDVNGISSNFASSVFQRASRQRKDVVELSYELGAGSDGQLEVSTTPFNSPNTPDGSGVVEFVRSVEGPSGTVRIKTAEFDRGPGTRYFRLIARNKQGALLMFSSDPVSVLVED